MAPAILVTGGSGYLGQFVVAELSKSRKVGFTYWSSSAPSFQGDVTAVKVDLTTGEGLEAAVASLGGIEAVVNCAAISNPGACEKAPDMARALNVPTPILKMLELQKQRTGIEAPLIHLSTDQVYDGGKAFWKESDPCKPVNIYGRTKLEAEQAIKAAWPRSAILRSSIIYGPLPPQPVGRGLFLQFVDSALEKGEKTTFFQDEFRNPVYIMDILRVIKACLSKLKDEPLESARVWNMGGPQRMSRVDFAEAVANLRGWDRQAILPVPAASVDRGVKSPADISMDSSLLQEELGISLRPLAEALKDMGMAVDNA